MKDKAQIDNHNHVINNNVFFANDWSNSFKPYVLENLIQTKSVAEQYNNTNHISKNNSINESSYLVITLLFCLILTVVLELLSGGVRKVNTLLSIKNLSKQSSYTLLPNITLHFISFLSFSCFLAVNIEMHSIKKIPNLYSYCLIFSSCFLISRWCIRTFINVQFKLKGTDKAYTSMYYNTWLICFFMSLPILVLIVFGKYDSIGLQTHNTKPILSMLYFILFFIGYLIVTFISGKYFLTKKSISIFHIILYICTLDFLPLAIAIKMGFGRI